MRIHRRRSDFELSMLQLAKKNQEPNSGVHASSHHPSYHGRVTYHEISWSRAAEGTQCALHTLVRYIKLKAFLFNGTSLKSNHRRFFFKKNPPVSQKLPFHHLQPPSPGVMLCYDPGTFTPARFGHLSWKCSYLELVPTGNPYV